MGPQFEFSTGGSTFLGLENSNFVLSTISHIVATGRTATVRRLRLSEVSRLEGTVALRFSQITHNAFPFSMEVDENLSETDWYNAVMEITLQGLRPQLDAKKCPISMQLLIHSCWASDPARRPTMAKIIEQLDAMKEEFNVT